MRYSYLKIIIAIFILFLLWLIVPISRDLIVQVRIEKKDRTIENIYYFRKNKLKIVTNERVILLEEDSLHIINHKQKSYWKGSNSDYNRNISKLKFRKKSSNHLKKIAFHKKIKNQNEIVLNVEQKKKNQRTVLKEKCLVNPTPDYVSIAGYASRRYEMKYANQIVQEVWIAENLKHYLNYELNLDLYDDFTDRLVMQYQSKNFQHIESTMEIIRNGFPMRIVSYKDSTKIISEVKNLIRTNLKDEDFIVPSQYQMVELEKIIPQFN